MKTAICYYSRHHGNTLKVLEAMTREGKIDLIDVTAGHTSQLERYDCIGFASGVYYGKFHDSVLSFARQYLPEGKTYSSSALMEEAKGIAPSSWKHWLQNGAATCWEPSAARVTILLDRSSWWAASQRAVPMRRT